MPTGEQSLTTERLALTAWVSEMAEGELPEIALEGVDLAALTAGDEEPLFVTIEAVAETVSRNRRRYTAGVVRSIIEQVNERRPDGYAGHLRDEDRPFVAPQAETLWLGGVVQEIGGKLRGFVKGYVLPSAAERRDYLRRARAAGKRVAVSIYGTARGLVDAVERVFEVVEFELESIDWARPGAEGIVTSGAWSLTSEQAGDGAGAERSIGGRDMAEATLREMLAQVTAGELIQVAPALVEQIVREAQERAGVDQALRIAATVRELMGLPDVDGIKAGIQEMKNIIAGVREVLDVGPDGDVRQAIWDLTSMVNAIREALGVNEEANLAGAVTEMASERRQARLEQALAQAVANEAARPAVRAIAVAEMRAQTPADVGAFVAQLVAREDVKGLIESLKPAQRMPVVNPGRDNRDGQPFKFLT